jgi:hypothetical protein
MTRQVFDVVARARPRQLFVFADGARSRAEERRCRKSRAIVQQVDWECDVHHDFSPTNLGSRARIISGLDWVASQVEEFIFLEDDCVPDPTFFTFCDAMIERYRSDRRVMMVAGANYVQQWKPESQSYHFSAFGGTYGWATWRRAWSTCDVTMAEWADDATKEAIRRRLDDDDLYTFQAERFDRLYADRGNRHVWDLYWLLARLAHGGLTVVPALNLVENIGNMKGRGIPPDHPLANLERHQLAAPYVGGDVEADREYDRLHVGRIRDWWLQGGRVEPPRSSIGARIAGKVSRSAGQALRGIHTAGR